ncbi:redoxin domain-containing protein [Thecamonas trahens ATCC 50062]|uniref:Redoxin domain-containing protein n=1 Tax=Thecamonas trahens ATCC 50062 TaxID=461836 RepID=A0A0L0DBN1_THETB|nr:redoxin domain-containing protein [Thecamonas trahens ATCC 50062]KNC49747.1 redoxin domain-containing protein [Thecamonas trahens ATCC 50062]|eukprot:XP_013757533.1 redoxin domain-containing protein [Thecamonas trahens ATCC 50062]
MLRNLGQSIVRAAGAGRNWTSSAVSAKVAQLPVLRATGGTEVKAEEALAGKTVVVGVVGAFTGVCTSEHVPAYARAAEALKAKGVDGVRVVSVNDHLVMDAWAESMGLAGEAGKAAGIEFLSDPDASFTSALDLSIDLSGAGLGTRSQRYAMIVENGQVKDVFVETVPSEVSVSGVDHVLSKL